VVFLVGEADVEELHGTGYVVPSYLSIYRRHSETRGKIRKP
jgi:hypothetical protein